MKSFAPGVLERQKIPMAIVRAVGHVGELKGRLALHRHTRGDALLALAAERPTIRPLPPHAAPTPDYILQVHADVCADTTRPAGRWRPSDGVEDGLDGMLASRQQFRPPAAADVEELITTLCATYRARVAADDAEPLFALGAFTLDFLCVCPFAEGSARVGWRVADVVLRDLGYDVTRYVGLGSAVEDTLPACQAAFEASTKGWHAAWHDLTPWWAYFLATLTHTHEELDARLAAIPHGRVLKSDTVRKAIEELPSPFSISDLERACPEVSRPLIRRVMSEMKGTRIRLLGRGPRARWERI
ncbi:hypothetical protein HN371_04345 [Candidatus Poribacteria bacterium]|nr:hypothetical protein [Candidatus Poribacteria bacterium]MBT5536099.1 hypothetical protein [Candidatus Poribacteria bacterium]MBT5711566.1 hypothetical protein [Candidatus Poribacteria bacterium]MBT7806696.1 hypothetical protein [Candidatus Poribacteria bacterium]